MTVTRDGPLNRRRPRRPRPGRLVVLLLAGAVAVSACTAQTLDLPGIDRGGVSIQASWTSIHPHLAAFARIADEQGGNRAAGHPGHDASAEYVFQWLRDSGYEPEYQEFTFAAFDLLGFGTIEVPGRSEPLAEPEDVKAMIYSADGDVSAPVTALGFPSGPSGCEESDFEGFAAGHVALLRPGPCFRRDQVLNAQAAGAVAVVVSYPEWDAGAVRRPTLFSPAGIEIPAMAASNEAGSDLWRAAQDGAAVRVRTHTRTEERVTRNVLAELPGREGGSVVMAGAHLDSTLDGPGINDNGSGAGALLQLASAMASLQPRHTVRFAFWSAEEVGLAGSTHYVESLDADERADILAYVNLDMIASPNFARLVYADADAPAGSDHVRAALTAALGETRLDAEPFDMGGGSDHGPFMRAGIPVGGLFSGASELKSVERAERFGGEAGEPLDPCYHLPCDDLDNIDREVLEHLATAAGQALLRLAGAEDLDAAA